MAISGTGYDTITMREACAPCGGMLGEDLRFTNQDSIKGCRMHASSKPIIRSKSDVGLTTGIVGEHGAKRPVGKSKNARRKARRYR